VSPRSTHFLPTLALLLLTRSSLADDTQQCVDGYVEAQKLQRAAKLLAARDRLIVCADAKCPDAVRSDCLQWMAWNEAAIPSILLQPLLPEGASLASLRIEVDGQSVTTPAPGYPLPLDPGAHRLRFTLPGAEPSEQQIRLRPGEKARPVTIQLRVAEAVEPPSEGPSAESVAAYTLWGLGGAGLIAFAILGSVGNSEIDDLSESCAPDCTDAEVDQAWNKLIAADVSGVVGLVSLALGMVVYFTQPDEPATESAQRLLPRFASRPLAGGALLEATVAF
jgi:hypothetical protein